MPFYRCAVCREDGTTLAQGMQVVLEERDNGDARVWYGTITATRDTLLEAGHTYRLTLDDGRTGVFHVRRNTVAGETERSVAIVGVGPLAPSGG